MNSIYTIYPGTYIQRQKENPKLQTVPLIGSPDYTLNFMM